jgi:hypothetical protein
MENGTGKLSKNCKCMYSTCWCFSCKALAIMIPIASLEMDEFSQISCFSITKVYCDYSITAAPDLMENTV